MKYIYLLTLFFLFIFMESLMSHKNKDPYLSKEERLVDDILERTARLIKRKFNVSLSGEGAAMPGGIISGLTLTFDTKYPFSKEELRRLLLNCAQEVVTQVQMNNEIQPFLKKIPFTVENVQIIIYNSDREGREVMNPGISTAEISHGFLKYRTVGLDNMFRFKDEFKETYDEAVKILEKF